MILSHAFQLLSRGDPLGWLLGPGVRLGDLAVDGFFLISGCLIVASWQRNPNLGRYLGHRFARIYPGFVVAYLISALIVGPIGGNPRYFSEFSPAATFWAILTLKRPVTPPVFAEQAVGKFVNASMWTIRYEMICYLLVAALGLLGLFRRRRLTLALAFGVLGVYLADCQWNLFERFATLPASSHFAPAARLFSFFLAGACVTLYADTIRFTGPGMLVAAILFVVANRFGPAATQAAILFAGGYLLFGLAYLPSRPLRASNGWPDLSYGIYLYSWPIQVLMIHWWPSISPMVLFLASLLLCLPAGAASWFGVERRFLRSGHRGDPPTDQPSRPRGDSATVGSMGRFASRFKPVEA